MSKLTSIFENLIDISRRTGKMKYYDLKQGARIEVKVIDEIVKIAFLRPTKPLSDTEIVVFTQHCHIPATARRVPAEGQGNCTIGGEIAFYVGYEWRMK